MRRVSILVPLTLAGIGTAPLEQLMKIYEGCKQPDTVLEVDQIEYGPATIESHYDEQLAAAFCLQAMGRAVDRGVDAILCSCFGDVAVTAGRELCGVPVMGTGLASMTVAAGIGRKFGIVNLLPASEPLMWDLARGYGFGDRCVRVATIGMAVAEFVGSSDHGGDVLRKALLRAGQQIVNAGGDVVLLGCGGFGLAGIVDWLSEQLGAVVIDPNVAALKFTEMLIECGLCHSRLAYPEPADKIRRLPE